MRAIQAIAIFFFLSAVFPYSVLGQSLTGTIHDSLGVVISSASINLKGREDIVLNFAVSSEKGTFHIDIPEKVKNDTLLLEVSCIGYQTQSKKIIGASLFYDFVLRSSTHQLKEVVVKNNRPKLKLSGDTLNYKVSDFSSPQDRMIGDVIKKLPGIHVDENGTISYNGKTISNFYIEGDNLLDDKYNIATGSVPSAVVDKIQVMENHQPIRLLQGKVMSDDVAINITIKDNAKVRLLGQGTFGGGFNDKYDADVDAMMFKNKYKAINYLKANNTSKDISSDLVAHNTHDSKNINDSNPGDQLSLGTAGNPDLPVNRYLFNNSALLNLNNLIKLKDQFQFKVNLSFLHNEQRQQFEKFNKTIIGNDTIVYKEDQNNHQTPDLLHLQLNANINTKRTYLNNAFVSDINKNTAYSSLLSNNIPFRQNLQTNSYSFSNELNYLINLKSGFIINFYSNISHFSQPENLKLDPGPNADIFNHNQPYSQLVQNLSIPTFITNNYIAAKQSLNKITLQYKVGFNIQSQQMFSNLYSIELDQSIKNGRDSTINQLHWLRQRFYMDAGFDIPGQKFLFSVSLPVIWEKTNYNEPDYQLEQSQSNVFVNPQLKLKYQTGKEAYISFKYKLSNNNGNIDDVYRGYILKNYRTINANNAGLSQQITQGASLGYFYAKAVDIFFFSLTIDYEHINANTISASSITSNFQQRIILPFHNATDNWLATGNISKYAFNLCTTFSGGPFLLSNSSVQIQNNKSLPYTTLSTGFKGGIETKISKTLNFSYNTSFSRTYSLSTVMNGPSFVQIQQEAVLNYIPTQNLFFKVSDNSYYTRQPSTSQLNYSFIDFSSRYILEKKKIEFEVSALNIFDIKTYTTTYLSANILSLNTFNLPGRTILAKIKFTF